MSEGLENQVSSDQRVMLAHGGGGELTRRLLAERVIPKLQNDVLAPLSDSAMLPPMTGRVCMTTDAFVVQPIEFPGGDIGRLAVCGTVNDLAVAGATPKVLSLALVIEEGLPFELLDRVVDSIAQAAKEAGVVIGTGDTKVIERRSGDGLTITTAGVGELRPDANLSASRINAGDAILINGYIADHGLAVMSAREGLAFDTKLVTDAAPLNGLIAALYDAGVDLKFLRDPTRGGVAGLLADLAEETGLGVEIQEDAIPMTRVARHTAELLGLDPLTVANEGKVVAVVSESDVAKALETMRNHPLGEKASVIGRVFESDQPVVDLVTTASGRRIVQRPYGEDLPRIC